MLEQYLPTFKFHDNIDDVSHDYDDDQHDHDNDEKGKDNVSPIGHRVFLQASPEQFMRSKCVWDFLSMTVSASQGVSVCVFEGEKITKSWKFCSTSK